jgi:L-lysine 6-transaminase
VNHPECSKTLLDDMRRLGIMEPRDFVIDLAKCHGSYLVTVEGREIADWAGYYGSRLLSHNHPAYREPAFMERLHHACVNKVSNPDFVTPELVAYYRLLHRVAPTCMTGTKLRTFTVNSGAEAVENALKYCIAQYHHSRGGINSRTPNPRFMSFYGGFHGRTVYALHVTDMPHNEDATQAYHPLIENQSIKIPFPGSDMNSVSIALEFARTAMQRHQRELAGIIVEPMQGAGGHNVTLPMFFQGLSELAHQHAIPLIFDEVQTGGGLTGTMWACDQFDLPHPPTCVVSAKKFGCGVIYMNDLIPTPGILDSTWSGHIADMVRVVHEFDVIEREGLLRLVGDRARRLTEGLRELQRRHNWVINIRGMGLYQGFSVGGSGGTEARDELVRRALIDEDLLVLKAGLDTVRFRPNICVTNTEIDDLLERLDRLFCAL